MSVALRRQRDGKLRPFWYGEYRDGNGRRVVVNLGKWRGSPPPALLGTGDATTGDEVFEASRDAAETELKMQADDAKHKGRAEHLVERLIEVKTGRPVEHVRIDELAERWLSMPRGGELTKAHKAGVEAVCERFRVFMRKRRKEARYLYEVTSIDAGRFAEEMRRKYAPRTARGYTVLLRSAFRRFLPSGVANPFAGIVASHKGENGIGAMVHRRPFTQEELRQVLEAANGNDFMGGLITAAACTGMRRGDVCRLRWSDVDLAAGMVTAKASKTGEPVEVPIFAPFRTVLDARKGKDEEYVFAEAARMLEKNPDGLTYRFKAIVARALDQKKAKAPPQAVPAAEIEEEAAAAIAAHVEEDPRRERMLDTLHRYAAGASVREIEKATGRARATVSVDLQAIQRWIGKRFVRAVAGPNVKEAIDRITRTDQKGRQRAASVRDWHALRTTFVTLALTAGVPMELVRRVTGHQTVEIVLRHYFRPDREQFRASLNAALPDVLTGKPVALTPAKEVEALGKKFGDGTATKEDKSRLQKLLRKM